MSGNLKKTKDYIPLALKYNSHYDGNWIVGLLYSPSFLNASNYMISSVPHAMEFVNSLAISFGNLGVTLGTTAGGWIIATKGAISHNGLQCFLSYWH